MKPLLLAGWIAAFGGDASTTAYGLAARGGREVVLPTQNPTAVVGIVAGEAVFCWWAYRKVKPEHPKLAVAIYVANVVAHGWATAHNIKELRK